MPYDRFLFQRLLFVLHAFALLSPIYAQAPQPPDQAWQMRFRNDAVVMPVDAAKSLGSAYTIQIWAYPEQTGTFMNLARRVLDDPDTDPKFSFSLLLNQTGQVQWQQSTGAPGSATGLGSTNPLPLKQWSHIAITNDGSVLRGYINGVQFAQRSSPGTPVVSNQPITLGAQVRPANVTNPGYNFLNFVGMLRQFGIWNRALSVAEIQSAMRTTFTGSESGLVGFWPLDDGPGYTFHDVTSSGKTASLFYPNVVTLVNGDPNFATSTQYWPSWFQPSLASTGPFVWTDQTQGATEVGARTVTPIDFDNDGDLDLVAVGMWNPNLPLTTLKAYRNDGKGNFTEATQEVLGSTPIVLLGTTESSGFVSDLNHDGRADLILPDYGSDYSVRPVPGGTRIFIQSSDGRLVDESTSRIPARDNLTHDTDAADIDGDGNLDFFQADIRLVNSPPYFRMALMKNDGSGHFSVDNSRLPQSLAKRVSFASRFLDANRDGFPDLFLADGFGDTDLLFLNDGTGHFQEMVPGALPPKIGGSNGTTRRIAVMDLNQDGFPDVVLGPQNQRVSGFQVLINRRDATFEDRTADWLPDSLVQQSTLPATEIPFIREWFPQDFNGDGYPDLLVDFSGPTRLNARLFMNNGKRLVDTSSFLPGINIGAFGVGDFDGDGRVDIVYAQRDTAGKALLSVGLNKQDYAVPAPGAATSPPAPWFSAVSIHNDGSGSADALAPGTRIRIVGTNVGPETPVKVTEAPGVVLPTTLGGVSLTFDSTPARLISVSATEIVAVVPFAVTGQWMTTMRVSYQGRLSQPVGMLVAATNPMAYAKADPGKMIVPDYVVDAWKINGTQRMKVTQPGQITWGDRIAIRVTGLGQGQVPLTDDTVTQTQAFTPVNALPIYLGLAGTTTAPVTPVSMTWAPDGLAGIVEVVVDIPTANAATSYGSAFYIGQLGSPLIRGARNLRWPFDGPGGCNYTLTSGGQTILGQAFPSSGGTGSITMSAAPGCDWSVGNLPSGVVLLNGASGTGSGTIDFQVLANSNGGTRSFTIGGQTFTVEQQAASIAGLNPIGSLAQIVSAGTWETLLTYVNLGVTPAQTRTVISDNSGAALNLPLDFPQSGSSNGIFMASTLDRTLAPGATLQMHTSGPDAQSVNAGWVNLGSTGDVSGFAVFTNHLYKWNAVVPLETRNANSYVLPFDNTGNIGTGLAIANVTGSSANVPVLIRDDSGSQIGTGTISLGGRGHDSFMLADRYSVVVGKRGTIQFDTPAGGQISVLGLRAVNFATLTTVPVLANVAAGGGSMAQVAFSGGWDTTFTVVNTGTSTGDFTLNFYDESGLPLTLPLRILQTGATLSASSITRTLAAGASLVLQTIGDPAVPSVAGSAILLTTASISAHANFRWNVFQQEAVVPLETRNPGSFVLAFDNTNGLVAGVAIAEVSGAAAQVTVKIRDDSGTLLEIQTMALPGHGHQSFLLSDRFSSTAGKRGTVEFVTSIGSRLSVLGLRAKNDGTLSTIPALVP